MIHLKKIARSVSSFKVITAALNGADENDCRHAFVIIACTANNLFFLVRTAEYDEIQETLEEIAKENTLLKEKAKQADVLTEVLQELVGESQ